MDKIHVQTNIKAPLSKVWLYWTQPEHITKWNFASPDWHCPNAVNDLVTGGEFHYLMAAKDDSFKFDFWGTYISIIAEKNLEIVLRDRRKMTVTFEKTDHNTLISEFFEPENENPVEMQKSGWQAILDNFRLYAERQ